LLLELWNQDLVSHTELARHELVSARSRARAVCVKAEVSRRNADRLVELRKRDVVTEERADNATSEATALEAECRASQSEIAVREARLNVLRADLESTRLMAPFDGVIAEINGELFEFVTPRPWAWPPRRPSISSTIPVFMSARPSTRWMPPASAWACRRASPWTPTGTSTLQAGCAHCRLCAGCGAQARTVDVEVAFEQPPKAGFLLAGYSADIEVIQEVRENVVRVPTEAVFDERRAFGFSCPNRAGSPGVPSSRDSPTGTGPKSDKASRPATRWWSMWITPILKTGPGQPPAKDTP
jgi:HlyD family secretion protein